jgi:radical SAM-linked protein
MSFPLALGVGMHGLREIVEMDLSEWLHPAEAQRRLNEQLPLGLRMTECRAISPRDTAQAASAVYEIELAAPLPAGVGPESLLAAKELRTLRRREDEQKEIDVRPYLLDASGSGRKLTVHLKVTPSGSARPGEVVAALGALAGVEVSCAKITRTHVNMAAPAEGKRQVPR